VILVSQEKIKATLESLREIKGVHGAALIEKFGLVAGEALPGWLDSDAISAMVTLILKASQRATKELEQGAFIRATLENAKGLLIFAEAGGKIVVVVATNEAKLGIINIKLNAAMNHLKDI